MLDSVVRTGLLTFLPFLLKAKGAGLPTVGLALALVFLGGAEGKFACGHLGARIGLLRTVLATEAGTPLAILGVLALPLAPALAALPLALTLAPRLPGRWPQGGAVRSAGRMPGARV